MHAPTLSARRLGLALAMALGIAPLAGLAAQAAGDPSQDLASIAASQPGTGDWPSYNHDPGSQRYSPLSQINTSNVAKLKPTCTYDTGRKANFEGGLLEVNGILYGTAGSLSFAIDANTCQQVWSKDEGTAANGTNRGMVYLDGRVFRGTNDGRVVAYNAKTGKRLWQVTIADPSIGENVDAAPIAWNHTVYIGNSGGDSKGVKGHIFAIDAKNGGIKWEAFLVPRTRGDVIRGPLAKDPNAKAANFTWMNEKDFPITGGGTWTSYTLDPERGLLYIPGGNPAPDFYTASREGDNLYTDSVVVLDARTGTYKTHFQLIPNDFHDWDVSSAPVLATTRKGHQLVLSTPKDGHLYAIDLANGRLRFKNDVTTVLNADTPFSTAPTHYCPGIDGGSEWNGPSFDAKHNLVLTGQIDWCNTVQLEDASQINQVDLGQAWTGAISSATFGSADPVAKWSGHLTATDADSGQPMWRFDAPAPLAAGVTSTAGDLVFAADMVGNVYAFDVAKGTKLWSAKLDGATGGGLITYDSGQGQHIAVADGMTSGAWHTPTDVNAKVVVYGL